MHIFHYTKKRILFLLGIFLSGILGTIGDYFNSNYSKSDSLIIPTVHADYVNYAAGGDSGAGSSSGGCSGDGSY